VCGASIAKKPIILLLPTHREKEGREFLEVEEKNVAYTH